ncbi:FYVE-domain-containing protein [Mytilinidion resinicola]|uniref:RING-type E3 ubiquitin transferase n=1 Tax=Mytilinidion resinicola TaxID=574789 RepID=A0A6A6Z438_9PEZI|nr:FYVE-domain-containing protein [Mytilinidion resinicola]KAF2815912.1 FYVE-domain-containing protein [Mytilinidion resinicola]
MDQSPYPPGGHARAHSRSTPNLPPPFVSVDNSNNMIVEAGGGSEGPRLTTEVGREHSSSEGAAASHSRAHSNSSPMPALQLSSSVGSDDTVVAGSQGTIRARPSGGHTYSDGATYPHNRGQGAQSSRGQTWQDFLRESGGDAAEGPYPSFLDQPRRRSSRLSYVESANPRPSPQPPTTLAPSDRKRRSTAPEPPPTAQPGHHRGHSSVSFTRPPLPLPRPPRQRSHAHSASASVLPSSNLNLYASHRRQSPLPPLPPLSQQSPRRLSSFHPPPDYFQNNPPQDSDDIMLPPWQPDSEVTQCPVCSSNFTFFTRKHHCRKCGRVVCARCSPHRITIPRQFIVCPPLEDLDALSPHAAISAGESNFDAVPETFSPSALNPALGGGEEVRVCNPCVPDPNFSPPPRRQEVPQGSSQPLQNTGRQRLLDRTQEGHNAFSVGRNGHLSPHQSPSSTASTQSSAPRVPSPADSLLFPTFEDDRSIRRVSPAPTPRARNELTEDEMCPVCGRELPPVPAGVDRTTAREEHVAACITDRMSGSPAGNAASASGSGRQTNMSYQKLTWKATEKDCEGECIVCFEEYEEGEDLARLACLCKFHNACIAQWWAVKGPGSCPTHQLQV